MKKVCFSLLAIVLALFMVACDNSTTPPADDFAPSWAIGTYNDTELGGIVNLTVEEDSINVKVLGGLINISSASATVESSDVTGNRWIVELSNVDVAMSDTQVFNDNNVTLTVDKVIANEELKMSIVVEGSLADFAGFQVVKESLENGLTFKIPETTTN